MKLLLDVDGVLCPFGSQVRNIHPKDRDNPEDRFPGYTYHPTDYIYTSPDNATRIKRLMNNFDVHWCTGWMNAANDVIAPIHGLPAFPVAPVLEYDLSNVIHWKFNCIQEYTKDEPYVFIDDDIGLDGIDYAIDRTKRGIPTLWVPTYCHEGLTDAHVELIEQWLKQQQASKARLDTETAG